MTPPIQMMTHISSPSCWTLFPHQVICVCAKHTHDGFLHTHAHWIHCVCPGGGITYVARWINLSVSLFLSPLCELEKRKKEKEYVTLSASSVCQSEGLLSLTQTCSLPKCFPWLSLNGTQYLPNTMCTDGVLCRVWNYHFNSKATFSFLLFH